MHPSLLLITVIANECFPAREAIYTAVIRLLRQKPPRNDTEPVIANERSPASDIVPVG
jgi:hypothetical protein